MTVLITGGTGYIGSHTAVELLQKGYNVVIVDNLCNSKKEAVNRIKRITGKEVEFYDRDLLDVTALRGVFENHRFTAVVHFAALKVLSESINKPLLYYRNNVQGSINLFELMNEFNVKQLVFSSTAAIYGKDGISPIQEDYECHTDNPYGRTKYITEQLIKDIYKSNKGFSSVILRYFNPIGAHNSGLIGEDAKTEPDNLLPYVAKTAMGKMPYLYVYGNDYDTYDGTGVRDYIHVVDLAQGHLKALEKLSNSEGVFTYNLGRGEGYSVLDVVKTFEKVSGEKINYRFRERRDGDLACVFADPTKAERELDWKARLTLEDMCVSVWNWQQKNPEGYEL